MEESRPKTAFDTRLARPVQAKILRFLHYFDLCSLLLGIATVLVHAGFSEVSHQRIAEIRWMEAISMSALAGGRLLQFVLRIRRGHILQACNESRIAAPVCWLAVVGTAFVSEAVPTWVLLLASPLALSAVAVLSVLSVCRNLAARTRNSAVLLVGSFLVVIAVGTLLLKMPACRPPDANGQSQTADWDVALFTATSASCVTGLALEPTGTYWSDTGHAVIFGLFQIGGLGILTFGAFVAILSGRRGLQFREARTLREMLDADSVRGSRKLLMTILLFTLAIEAFGALAISGLWADKAPAEQAWHSIFHSVSAFCNAGFSLHDDGFLNTGTRWQVWGPLSLLIILGGLGFPVLFGMWPAAVIHALFVILTRK